MSVVTEIQNNTNNSPWAARRDETKIGKHFVANFLAHCLLLGKKKPAVTHFIILKMQGLRKALFKMIKLIIRYLKNYVIHNIEAVHTKKKIISTGIMFGG